MPSENQSLDENPDYMTFHQSTTQYHCGIDLHSKQMYVCVMDAQGNKLLHMNIKNNDFEFFLKKIAPGDTTSPSAANACSVGTGSPMPARTQVSNSSSPTRSISRPSMAAKIRTTALIPKRSHICCAAT